MNYNKTVNNSKSNNIDISNVKSNAIDTESQVLLIPNENVNNASKNNDNNNINVASGTELLHINNNNEVNYSDANKKIFINTNTTDNQGYVSKKNSNNNIVVNNKIKHKKELNSESNSINSSNNYNYNENSNVEYNNKIRNNINIDDTNSNPNNEANNVDKDLNFYLEETSDYPYEVKYHSHQNSKTYIIHNSELSLKQVIEKMKETITEVKPISNSNNHNISPLSPTQRSISDNIHLFSNNNYINNNTNDKSLIDKRRRFIDYLKNIILKMNFKTKTFFLTVKYLDIVSHSKHMKTNHYFLKDLDNLLVSLVVLSSKYSENDPLTPRLGKFIQVVDKFNVNFESIKRSEVEALFLLDYCLNTPTLYDFLELISIKGIVFSNDYLVIVNEGKLTILI